MSNTLKVIGKMAIIAACAALGAWLVAIMAMVYAPLGFPFNSPGSSSGNSLELFPFALIGCYAVGMPIALLIHALAGRQLARSLAAVFLIALLASIMMLLASFVIGGGDAMIILGIPASIAAFIFAGLGWLWFLEPLGRASGD